MTNREWLNSLSDEELANILVGLTVCHVRRNCEGCVLRLVMAGKSHCKKIGDVADWLKAVRSDSK